MTQDSNFKPHSSKEETPLDNSFTGHILKDVATTALLANTFREGSRTQQALKERLAITDEVKDLIGTYKTGLSARDYKELNNLNDH